MKKAKPYRPSELAGECGQRTLTGQHLLQIAMPLGGLGTGCICLNGHGGLQDFSIRNQPTTLATPDGHGTTDAAFAVLHIKGKRPSPSSSKAPCRQKRCTTWERRGDQHRRRRAHRRVRPVCRPERNPTRGSCDMGASRNTLIVVTLLVTRAVVSATAPTADLPKHTYALTSWSRSPQPSAWK